MKSFAFHAPPTAAINTRGPAVPDWSVPPPKNIIHQLGRREPTTLRRSKLAKIASSNVWHRPKASTPSRCTVPCVGGRPLVSATKLLEQTYLSCVLAIGQTWPVGDNGVNVPLSKRTV